MLEFLGDNNGYDRTAQLMLICVGAGHRIKPSGRRLPPRHWNLENVDLSASFRIEGSRAPALKSIVEVQLDDRAFVRICEI